MFKLYARFDGSEVLLLRKLELRRPAVTLVGRGTWQPLELGLAASVAGNFLYIVIDGRWLTAEEVVAVMDIGRSTRTWQKVF